MTEPREPQVPTGTEGDEGDVVEGQPRPDSGPEKGDTVPENPRR